uniref:Uncharacterized protein n=1 Tax=Anguilla anguilla TaxID=7936 RepID=A0A0E9THG9_ANGAN
MWKQPAMQTVSGVSRQPFRMRLPGQESREGAALSIKRARFVCANR